MSEATYDGSIAAPVHKFRTARALWRALDITRECWTPRGEHVCPWIFRGHGDAAWLLQPPTFRSTGPDAEVYAEARRRVIEEDDCGPGLLERGLEWDLRRYAETRLVREFAQLADRQGFPLPDQHASQEWGPLAPNPTHAITALAQHHRVPTCLLDFTDDPLVALQWATEQPQPDAEALAVWALHKDARVGKYEVRRYSHSSNPNLRAQSGVFVHFQQADDEVKAGRPLPRLDTCGGVRVGGLRCLVLPRTEVRELRRLLELRGMHRARLLPSLDGVAQTVVSRYAK